MNDKQVPVADMVIGAVGEELRARGAKLDMRNGVATVENGSGQRRIVPADLMLPFCRGLLQILREMDGA